MSRELRKNRAADRRKKRVSRRKKGQKVLSGYLLAQTLTGVATTSIAAVITSITSTQSAYAINNPYALDEIVLSNQVYYVSKMNGNTAPIVNDGIYWDQVYGDLNSYYPAGTVVFDGTNFGRMRTGFTPSDHPMPNTFYYQTLYLGANPSTIGETGATGDQGEQGPQGEQG